MSEYSDAISSYAAVPGAEVTAAANDNPDQAAEAIKLGSVSGIDPSIIHGDLDYFKQNLKSATGNVIVGQYPELQSYIRNNRLAASVSNDDWGKLGTFADKGGPLDAFTKFMQEHDPVSRGGRAAVEAIGEGLTTSAGVNDQIPQNWNPLSQALLRLELTPAELAGRLMNAVGGAAIAGPTEAARTLGEDLGGGPDLSIGPWRVLSSQGGAEGFARDIQGVVESIMFGGGGHAPEVTDAAARQAKYFTDTGRQLIPDIQAATTVAEPYIKNGVTPPRGLHPLIDQSLAAVNNAGLGMVDSAFESALESATRERSPEMFQKFVEERFGNANAKIGISGDAVAALYGDKIPEAGDGLLGFVPDIGAQLDLARNGVGDVHIGMTDFLANIDPQVYKTLHDDLRVYPEGITTREATEPPLPPKEIVDGPLPAVRAAEGLEPLYAVGDRKLKLVPTGDVNHGLTEPGLEFHNYNFLDENGQKVGEIELVPDPEKKQLYVTMVNGAAGKWANSFGPSLIRDLKRQLSTLYPDYSITGHRVTGARQLSGVWEDESRSSPVVKLSAPKAGEDTISADNNFRQILQDPTYNEVSKGHYAQRLSGMEPEAYRQLAEKVNDEVRRIAGQAVEIRPVRDIATQNMRPTGLYVRNSIRTEQSNLPLILYDLFSPDAIGTGRHEAIHHLRRQGFFTPQEWSALSKAVKDEGWIDRYDINERYAGAPDWLKNEEAIAEGYRDWAHNKDQNDIYQRLGGETPVQAVFRKMQELWEAVKSKFREVLGRDPTVDDVYGAVHRGDVAKRIGEAATGEPAYSLPTMNAKDEMDGLRAESVGLPKDVHSKLMDQVHEQFESDVKAAQDRAEREQRLRQGKEWKSARTDLRKDVAATIRQRPDVAADLFLSSGEIFGHKIKDGISHRLATDDLTPEQQAAIPKAYQAKSGLPVEGLARMFGYQGKDEFLSKLIDYNNAKAGLVDTGLRSGEKIEGPAIKVGDKIYRGASHSEALDRASAENKISPEEFSGQLEGKNNVGTDGFVTSEGRYLTRKEAYAAQDAIEKNEQVKGQALSSLEMIRNITDAETDRQMEAKYGSLEDNIMTEAKDQAVSDATVERVIQEYQAAAMSTGAPIDRAKLEDEVDATFSKLQIGSIKLANLEASIGKHANDAIKHGINGDPTSQLQSLQRKTWATMITARARKLSKAVAELDKESKRLGKVELRSMDPENQNWIQQTLARVGKKVARMPWDIEKDIQARAQNTLADFVAFQNDDMGQGLAVPDFLLDPSWAKPYAKLTVDEFYGLKDAIDSMAFSGRQKTKIFRAGEEMDFKDWRVAAIGQIAHLPVIEYHKSPEGTRPLEWLRAQKAVHTQMEAFINRMDRFDPHGLFNQFVMRDLFEGANAADRDVKKYAQRIKELKDDTDLLEPVTNTIWRDPINRQIIEGFNRGHLRVALLNAGSPSNLKVLAGGYKLAPEMVMDWLKANATKEDWAFAQKTWDIFDELKGKSDTMYRSLAKVAPKSVRVVPIDTPFGQMKGGYYPLIRHEKWGGIPAPLKDIKGLLSNSYIKSATPSAGYIKDRTGALYPLSFNLDAMPTRMMQEIHDINLRPALINAAKAFFDKDIERAVMRHFGSQYTDLFRPYIQDVANSANAPATRNEKLMDDALTFLRQNLVTSLVGFNPITIGKHGFTAMGTSIKEVGVKSFLQAARDIVGNNEETGESNWDFVERMSTEIQRRHQNFSESLYGATQTNLIPTPGLQGKMQGWNQWIRDNGGKPIAFADGLSSRTMWLSQYKTAMADNGGIVGDAVADADRAVRRAHGTTSIVGKSQIARRANPWLTSFYSFFSDMMNRQFEVLWQAGEANRLTKSGDHDAAMKMGATAAAGLFAYSLWPALVEHIGSPPNLSKKQEEQEGPFGAAARAMIGYEFSGWIGVRDLVAAAVNGNDPSLGLGGTVLREGANSIQDLVKEFEHAINHTTDGKVAHQQMLIRHAGQLTGILTGMPNVVSRATAYAWGVEKGTEKHEPWDWINGVRYGTAKERR